MPRVNLLLDSKRYNKLKLIINGYAKVEHKCVDELGRALGVNRRTIYRYLENPQDLQLDRLLKMTRCLGVPIEEVRECIRYN